MRLKCVQRRLNWRAQGGGAKLSLSTSAKWQPAFSASTRGATAALKRLDAISADSAFESAKACLEQRIKLWDWDEEVNLIGLAKVIFLPASS